MIEANVCERMRADWNQRAREDAHYYTAFGRRNQSEEEFLATGADVVRSLEWELKRLSASADPRSRRALEIGCGPGRLMLPLSRHFGEIHGVDVSDEMVRLGRERLRDIPQAHVHLTDGADLARFADESFDFVYSYAVFQHIPSREVVFRYLAEARRVLKAGGLLRCQINGLAPRETGYDTWNGVRISPREVADFARQHDWQLLALERAWTQYMWTTLRKQPPGWSAGLASRSPSALIHVRRITNAYDSAPVVAARGRFAFASLWVEGLPEECDLNHLEAAVGGLKGEAFYIGPPEQDGLQQINVALPPSAGTGLVPIRLVWLGKCITPPTTIRVIPPGPMVPRLISIHDGKELLSGTRIVSRCVKINLEEISNPQEFHATIGGMPVRDVGVSCSDPVPPRFEINFSLPETLGPGVHQLQMRVGRRRFPPVSIEVA